MRTFHTGGVAGEDITHGLPRVTELFEARRPKGQAILAEIAGEFSIRPEKDSQTIVITSKDGGIREYQVSNRVQFMKGIKEGVSVAVGEQLTRGSVNPHDLLRLTDAATTLRYIVDQVQSVYKSQGVDINDKHIEVIARQMLRKVAVLESGDSDYLPGKQVDRIEFQAESERLLIEGLEQPTGMPLLLGITKASLATDSFLSAASFQETTKVLTDAALEGREDELLGLKENVIIGKPIPAGTGLKRYRQVGLTYRGEKVDKVGDVKDVLPEFAPSELRELEELLPAPEWPLDDFMNYVDGGNMLIGGRGFMRGGVPGLSSADVKLYLFDDLGVSQRWANKFSEAGIETVGNLLGKTEKDLLDIDGIGVKALEELRAGLEERNLLHVLDGDDGREEEFDISEFIGATFAPDELIDSGYEIVSAEDAVAPIKDDDLIG